MRHECRVRGYFDIIDSAICADEMLDAGDLDGAAVWRRVLASIKGLNADKPRAQDNIH